MINDSYIFFVGLAIFLIVISGIAMTMVATYKIASEEESDRVEKEENI